MEVTRARIVSEALPRFTYLVRPRLRELREVGKSIQKAIVIVEHPRDLRLLEHQLRNENAVRIARFPPGQIATVLAIPGAQSSAERSIVRGEVARR